MRIVVTTSRCPDEVRGADLLHVPVLCCESVPLPALPDAFEAVFFSRNAVESVAGRVPAAGLTKCWAVGERTATAVKQHLGLEATTPEQANFLGLVDLLKTEKAQAPRVAFELEGGPRSLESKLPEVRSVVAYRTVPCITSADARRMSDFVPDWIVLGSPRGFDALQKVLSLKGVRLAAIGTTTAEAMTTAGHPPDHVAQSPSLEGLISELIALTR